MKKIVLILMATLLLEVSFAQRLVFNEKAPVVVVDSYIEGSAPVKGKMLYVDFYVHGAPQNLKELQELNAIAKRYDGEGQFLVITKENSSRVTQFFNSMGKLYFSVGYDSKGATFSNFDVKYIPFSVIVDRKGYFVWHGKSSRLSDDIIEQYL